jgi:hypothetical protein
VGQRTRAGDETGGCRRTSGRFASMIRRKSVKHAGRFDRLRFLAAIYEAGEETRAVERQRRG